MSDLLNSMVQNTSGTDHTVLSEKKAARNVVLSGLLLTLAAMGLSFFSKKPWPYFLGFLSGGAVAQLVFWLHGKNVDRSLKDPDKMALIQRGGYYLRLLIRGGALAAAYFIPAVHILAVFAGLMTVPAAIYILTFVAAFQSSRQGKRTEAGNAGPAEHKEE